MPALINMMNKINAMRGNPKEIRNVIHWRMNILGRNKDFAAHNNTTFASVTAYAHYCSGLYYNPTHDWSNRSDVMFSEVMLPDNAPREYFSRKTLWSEVERVEMRSSRSKDAQLARILVVALPTEFSTNTQVELIRRYVQDFFVNHGMCADINIHDNGKGNPHVHIILTMRSLDKDGNWMAKSKKVYALDKNGNKIYDRVKRQYQCATRKVNDWDNPQNVELWREAWANMCNQEYERRGLLKRVTHKSYKRQGIDLLPMAHLGAKLTAMERRGIRTRSGESNRSIHFRNLAQVSEMVCQMLQESVHRCKELLQCLQHQIQQIQPQVLNQKYVRKYVRRDTPHLSQYKRKHLQYERKYVLTQEPLFVPTL